MAIIIQTKKPNLLLKQLSIAINNGDIQTWLVDGEGDYTISRFQWFQHAWFRPKVEEAEKRLIFGIVQSSIYPMTRHLYGVYHGRLLATLLSHFDHLMDNVEVSPLIDDEYDVVM